ncbi:cleft lip and palate transmembrane protein (macronuclear) [Tetrahymena thermophila SB210]|uniref:Cleft lip and palate transmembrane protein n=1 Tax=Tetrahymena thermophila (strain SB210) TaxID=312017 RepID=Q22RI2_TETTS|nr:cleft lip and palate transmembrane protein [Tetrahymena thermophila SB210]EAR88140.2 cleft lip and palate transmembrane protein [Tetrahymena thermophila SB210]|eukprot:XP_001008385.2 cleft lip and palate transmembrane protein [Tetrahymena thermophila SB210]
MNISTSRRSQQDQQQSSQNQQNQQQQNVPAQQEEQQQQQQGGWNFSMFHMILLFIAGNFVFNMIKGNNIDRSNPNYYHNAFENDQNFDLKIKIIKDNEVLHSWETQNLQYNYDEKNFINKTFSLTQEQIFSEPYPEVSISIRNQDTGAQLNAQGELVVIQEKITKEQLQNLISSANEDVPQPKTKKESKKREKAPHFRQRFYIQLSHDTNSYHPQQIPPQLRNLLKIDHQKRLYLPILDVSQFWVRRKDLVYQGQIEEELAEENKNQPATTATQEVIDQNDLPSVYNTTIVFYPYWHAKLLMISQMEQTFNDQASYGLHDANSLEQFKEILGDNNPYYLAITFIVSILHSVFELLAVKNDISYWRNLENYQGLSLRSLYTGFVFEVVVFLYLLDSEETSWLIIASSGIELLVTVWKIYKTAKCQRRKDNKFPFFEIDQTQQSYIRTTEEYDKQATKYLYYALVPLLAGYTVYSLIYLEHKGWYSFVIRTLVGFIYVFGFINMTPQLYINYKLKSVEHLPWRTMIYKFLNTIVDDLFAFVISMPLLKRLSCFRDDIIFIIYIYQRQIYKVDHKRTQHGFKKEDLVPSDQKEKAD